MLKIVEYNMVHGDTQRGERIERHEWNRETEHVSYNYSEWIRIVQLFLRFLLCFLRKME